MNKKKPKYKSTIDGSNLLQMVQDRAAEYARK